MTKKELSQQQVKSKQRVTNHGEVYTSEREVNAMLDLVKQETERIDSRFLEPACGTGNFLIEIINRKMDVVLKRYKKSQVEFEKYTVLAVSSIYGIDILEDNVEACRSRLYEFVESIYTKTYKQSVKTELLATLKYILEKNIIWGDALTLLTVGDDPKPIVFAEWSLVNGGKFKRRDFTYKNLLQHEDSKSLPLFSDLGEEVYLPTPLKDYPLTHYLRISDD